MSYHLYAAPGAASLCVHWALLEMGQAFELHLLDTEKREHKSAAYLKLNPDGQLSASVAIVERLGSETIVNSDLPSGGSILAVLNGDSALRAGDSARFTFAPKQAILFDASDRALH